VTKRTGAVVTTATHAHAEHTQEQQLDESVTWSGRERLRLLWYRLRLVVQEMNYASKRMVELQMRLPDDWAVPAALTGTNTRSKP
jgi:hypothetical protein